MSLSVGPERPPAVSVIVPTHNRAAKLGQTLEALLAQETPPDLGWEILVVNNASTDGTLEMFRTAAARAPGRLRYVSEPRLGKSRALNAGIAVARGTVIALTDDDVSPAPDWVATAATVLDKWGAGGAGGRILPQWEGGLPSWLLEYPGLLCHLALMDYDQPAMLPVPPGSGPEVWGANMVFRRQALEAVGGFDVGLGPVGERRFADEDVDIVRRILSAGHHIVYDPALTVYHRIPRARTRRAYFRRVMWDMGEGRGLAIADPPSGPTLVGLPRWRVRYLAGLVATSSMHVLRRRPGAFEDVLDCFLEAGTAWGLMKRAFCERRRVSEGPVRRRPPPA